MKKHHYVPLITLCAVWFGLAIVVVLHAPHEVTGDVSKDIPHQIIEEKAEEETIDPLDLWLAKLEYCESTGNRYTINPTDNDGTPSFGPFQFKPDTLAYFGSAYGYLVHGTTGDMLLKSGQIFDRDLQRNTVKAMARDKEVDLAQQFPTCVRKIGLPHTNK